MSRATPLEVKIEDETLVIRIGFDALKIACEYNPLFSSYPENYEPPYKEVVDVNELAHDVKRALLDEEEDGTTPLHTLFDNAFVEAYEQGSAAFKEEE